MYHYTESGLENIWLVNGYDEYDTLEGKGVGIHDIDGLHHVIAQGIIDKPAPLTGKEFRFLRLELDLSQKAVGDLMDKSDQMVAKWEKEKNDVPVLADAAMRNFYSEKVNGTSIAGILERLKDLDRQLHEHQLKLEEIQGEGWRLDDCA